MKIGVITTSRADYGIYFPLLKELQESQDFELKLFCLGMHVSPKFGRTIEDIVKDGFDVVELEDTLVDDTDYGVSHSIGLTSQAFSKKYKENKVDLIICLGDRFEMFAAVSSLIPYNVKILHIHGGEETLGAIDNKFRHAITVLSDYHLVSCDDYLSKVNSLGANPESIMNIGSLSISGLEDFELFSREELARKYMLNTNEKIYMVTYHPVTVEPEKTEGYIDEFLSALSELDGQIIITGTNADTEGSIIKKKVKAFVLDNYNVSFYESLGKKGYFSLLAIAEMMLGNSSSGIIEAASFKLPVVNVGRRQEGRKTSKNVVSCREDKESILEAVKQASKIDRDYIKNIYFKKDSQKLALNFIKNIKVD